MTKAFAAAFLAMTLPLFLAEPARAHPGTGIVVRVRRRSHDGSVAKLAIVRNGRPEKP